MCDDAPASSLPPRDPGRGGKSATFIVDTLDGRIEAWNPDDGVAGAAESEATGPAHAAYTGLAIAGTAHSDELFAADYGTGGVDVFNSSFQQVKLAPWQFSDPSLSTERFRAFNTQALDGHIFVTYDTLNPDPAPGAGPEGLGEGVGAVDEFSTWAPTCRSPRSTSLSSWPARRPRCTTRAATG